MKDEVGGVGSEEFIISKPKMYSILGNKSSIYKEAKGVTKNVVAKISHDEYFIS